MPPRRVVRRAFIASFAVYLLPVVTVHIAYLWGWALGVELFVGEGGREPSWRLADLALALILQAAAFGVFVWIFAGRAWRWLALVLAAPALWYALNWTYLIALPSHFLIEAHRAPEAGDWPVACRIEEATLLEPRQPATNDLAEAREAWVGLGEAARTWALMSGPDCRLERPRATPPSERAELVAVAAGGAALFRAAEGNPARTRTWHLDPTGGTIAELAPPDGPRHWAPVLSRDGAAVGWVETRRDGQTPEHRLKTRAVASGSERAVPLADLTGSAPRLLALDGAEGGAMLSQYPGRVLFYGPDGAAARDPIGVPEIDHVGEQFLWLEDGWVAWEIYRDEGRLRLLWDLPRGRGRREVVKGSGITDLSVSADGALIAVSTTSNLSIGATQDALIVLRTRDGAEVYRRHYPKYTRTRLAFLGARHLAMTRADLAAGKGWIEVLEVRASAGEP